MKFKFGKHYTNQVFMSRHKNDTQQSADETPFAAEEILLAKPLSSADAAGELTSGAPDLGSAAPAEVCQRVLAPAKKAELREIAEILRKAKAGFSGAAETPAAENAPTSGEKIAEEGNAKAVEGQTISCQNGEESGSSRQQKEEISSCQSEETISCHQSEKTVVSRQSEEKLPCRRREEKGKRGVCEKHYALSNGSFEAVVYAAPVHTKNEKTGEFSDIESRIYRAEDGFSTGENVFDDKFAKTTAGGALFTLKKQGCEFRFLSADAEKEVQGVSVDGAVVYPDFQKGADLLYRVTGNRVKEDVVISERAEKYEYDFKIETDGLAFALSEKRDAMLYKNKKDGNVLFVLPVPVMEDAAGAESYDVYYDMQETASGFAVKVVASADWINDEARVFPVRIDPQVMVPALDREEKNIEVFSGLYSEGIMHAAAPNEWTAKVGRAYGSNTYRVFFKIRFPESLIEKDREIESASLRLSVQGYMNSSARHTTDTFVCNQIKAYIGDGSGFKLDFVGKTLGEYSFPEEGYNMSVSFDPEELNQKLAVGERTIYLELKNKTIQDDYLLYFNIPTEYHPTAAPVLNVVYKNANQMNEDHVKEYDVKSAGSVGVNLLSGNKTYTHTDLPAGGKLLTAVEHRFNERRSVNNYDCDVDVTHGKAYKVSPAHHMGKGWKLNLQRYLVNRNRGNILDEQISVLKYADERGSILPFTEKLYYEKDGKRVFVSANQLKKDADNQPITDENGRFIVSADGQDYTVQRAYFDQDLQTQVILGEGKAQFFGLAESVPDGKYYAYYDENAKKITVEPDENNEFLYAEGSFVYNEKPYSIDLKYTEIKDGARVFSSDGVDYPVTVKDVKKKIWYENGKPYFHRILQRKALCTGKTETQATELTVEDEVVYLIPDGLSACAQYMTEEISGLISGIAELRSAIKQNQTRIDELQKDISANDNQLTQDLAALQERYAKKAKELQAYEDQTQRREFSEKRDQLYGQLRENRQVLQALQDKSMDTCPQDVKEADLADDYKVAYSSATGQYVEISNSLKDKYQQDLQDALKNGASAATDAKVREIQDKINQYNEYLQYEAAIDRTNNSQKEINSALSSIDQQEEYLKKKKDMDDLADRISDKQKELEKQTTAERKAYCEEQIAAATQEVNTMTSQKSVMENKLRNALAQEKKEVLDFMVDGSGSYFGFDYYGRLCAIGAGEKRVNRIVWREDNKIAGITDENGVTLVSFTYNEEDLLQTIRDEENRETRFLYDENGNLTAIVYPESMDAEGKTDQAKTTFSYADGVLTRVKDRMGYAYEFSKAKTASETVVVATERTFGSLISEEGITSLSAPQTGTTETVTVNSEERLAKMQGPAETVRISFDADDNELFSYRINNGENTEGDKFAWVRDLSYHFKGKNLEYSVAVNKEDSLLTNGDFGSALSTGWTASSADDAAIVSGVGAAGRSSSLKLSSGADKSVKVLQNLAASKLGDAKCFVLSGWGKATSLALDRENVLGADADGTLPTFALLAKVTYTDNSVEYFRANFNRFDRNWQFAAVPVMIDRSKIVKTIAISAEYCYNNGDALFTGIRFAKDDFTFTENNPDKTLKRKVENGASFSYLAYENERPVQIETIDRFGKTVTQKLRYDRKGNLLYAENTDGDVSENEYDDNGVLLRSATYHKKDPSSRFVTESETDDYGRTVKEYTPRGEFPDGTGAYTSYTYYGNDNRVRSVVSPSGAKLYFGYDNASKRKISLTQSACDQDNTMKLRYDAGLLTAVETGDDGKVSYKYDGFGRVTEIKLDGTVYCTVSYPDHYGSRTVTYANGDKKSWSYTSRGDFDSYTYTPAGSTSSQMMRWQTYNTTLGEYLGGALYTGVETKNFFLTHTNGRLTKWSFGNDAVNYTYDTYGRLTGRNVTVDGSSVSTTFAYDSEKGDRLKSATCGYYVHELLYDDLGRVKGKVHTFTGTENAREQYSFVKSGDHATGLISSIRYAHGANGKMDCTLQYQYDKAGNISAVYENGNLLSSYEYDALGRLTRENAAQLGKTTTFVYDGNGNILVRREYPYTIGELSGNGTEYLYTYAAAKRNRLLSYDGEGVSYDVLGNPTTYRGKALTFTRCHLVNSFDGTAFVYDGDGNRVKKTPQEGTATEYFYADGTLYKEKFGVDTILYYRDEDGEICSFMLNYSPYILRKNAQGDVIALCDSNGAVVARYVYDAWGNHKVLNPDGTENTSAGFIGNINPIRYRGYYFDKDFGLYWLKTRFYDPQTGRFISPDSVEYLDPETLGGINLYAYCNNNPVMNVDPNGTTWDLGTFWKGFSMVATAITAIVLSVTTFGAGIPLAMSIVAGVTLGAGALTGINGVATLIESGTGYNFVRDGLFNSVLGWSDSAYDTYSNVVDGIATVGSMVLGVYHATGQYKAAKEGQRFLGKGYKKAGVSNSGKPRYVSKDGLRQMRFDDPHMYKGRKIGKHLNLELLGRKMKPVAHILYDLFDSWHI